MNARVSTVAPAHPAFRAAPPLRVYLHHAYTTGLLAANPAWRGTLLNHYLQVQLAADEYGHEGESFDFFPFVDHRMLGALGIFRLRSWPAHEVVGRPEAELTAALQAALDGRRCLEVHLDEYFVPTSWAFRQRHFRHQHLLIGFVDGWFVGVGYGADGRFGYSRIPPPLLHRAILSRDRASATYASRPSILEIDPHSDHREAPDPHLIGRQLEDFLGSRNRYAEYSAYPFARDIAGARYGLAAYGEIFGRVRAALADHRRCDPRYSRLVLERAQLMVLRLDALAPGGRGRALRGLRREWQELVEAWRAFHVTLFEHNVRIGSGRRGVDESAALPFEENVRREAELTRRVVDGLR